MLNLRISKQYKISICEIIKIDKLISERHIKALNSPSWSF